MDLDESEQTQRWTELLEVVFVLECKQQSVRVFHSLHDFNEFIFLILFLSSFDLSSGLVATIAGSPSFLNPCCF